MNPLVYPIITLLHISNPTAPPAKEVTVDGLMGGIGIEFGQGFSVEAKLGVISLGCTARDCGRQPAAEIEFTWRGKRR